MWKREDLYQGPYLSEAPDVIGLEHDGYLFLNWVPATGAIVENGVEKFFSAFHRLNGILIARGPGVAPGATVNEARLIDVTPTVLALLHVPIPDNMDGRPLEGLFVPGWTASHRPGTQPAVAVARQASDGRSRTLESQLRSVGYIR